MEEKKLEKLILLDWDGDYKIASYRRYPNLARWANDRPTVAFYETHVQIGCLRVTYNALRSISTDADRARFMIQHKVKTPIILQEGTYLVKDPLGNVRKDAGPDQPNSDVAVPSA